MHLIEPLVAGIAGAEGGSVVLRKRGSSTAAAYYSDFEAQTPLTTASVPLALDANGGAVAYVNEMVDCVVLDTSGATIREFVAGSNATAVEVISQSFVGTDYETGVAGASLPLSLQAVLDMWKTSAGTTNFNVLGPPFGSAVSLASALGAVGMTFINVKSAPYSATGDGATDDTSSIAAALTAANSAGGATVFFPKGTYRITSQLAIPDKVNLLGVSAGASIIAIDHPTAHALTYNAPTTGVQSISDLFIAPLQANSGNLVYALGANYLSIDRCYIGHGTFANGNCVRTNNTGVVRLTGCTLATGSAAGVAARFTLGIGIMVGCRIVPFNASGTDVIMAEGGSVIGCVFANDLLSGGITRINVDATGTTYPVAIVGNVFRSTAATTVNPWRFNGNAKGCAEFANAVGTGHSPLSGDIAVTAAASTHEGATLGRMAFARYYVATDATPITVPFDIYATCEIERSTNAAQTINFASPPGPGILCALVFYNNQVGGSGTITIGGNVKGLASFTVNASSVSYYFFRSVERGTSKYWTLVGSTVNVTP